MVGEGNLYATVGKGLTRLFSKGDATSEVGGGRFGGYGESSVIIVIDNGRSDTIGADERHAATDEDGRKGGGDERLNMAFDIESVLDENDNAVRFGHQRQDVTQNVVGSGLERDEDDITLGHAGGVVVGMEGVRGYAEVALDGVNGESRAASGGIFGMKEEVDVIASGGKSSSKVGTEGTGADDGERKHKYNYKKDVR